MKPSIILVVVFIAWSVRSESQSHSDWQGLREQVVKLRLDIAKNGVYALATNCAAQSVIAPYIHSQCWVDWLPRSEPERIEYEQEKRKFGLDVVGCLERYAIESIPLEDIDWLDRRAEMMLAVSEWLKTSGGYGNLVLKKWSEGLALSAIGSMVVNDKCDTNRVNQLLSRIDSLQESLARQIHVLNEESPHKYRMPTSNDPIEAEKELVEQWQRHVSDAWIYFGRIGKRKPFDFRNVREERREYAFYVPEHVLEAYVTPRTEWGVKNHDGVCVHGADTTMVDQIKELLRYRGGPGEIMRPKDDQLGTWVAGEGYRTCLHSTWCKWTNGKERLFKGAGAAWMIYDRTFVDWNTRALQLQQKAKNSKH